MLSGMGSAPEIFGYMQQRLTEQKTCSDARICMMEMDSSNESGDFNEAELNSYLDGSKQCVEILSMVVDKLFFKI
jgi:hypothetical protein